MYLAHGMLVVVTDAFGANEVRRCCSKSSSECFELSRLCLELVYFHQVFANRLMERTETKLDSSSIDLDLLCRGGLRPLWCDIALTG